jgi:hypothetical protein
MRALCFDDALTRDAQPCRSAGGQSMMGGTGTDGSGISNLEYDLVTTLSNLLEAHDVLDEYTSDAKEAGDEEAAEIFRTIQRNNHEAAMRIRMSLARLMSQ